MKQLVTTFSNGEIELLEVPAPSHSSSFVLTESSASLISSGTERMLVQFGRSNFFDKARSQPAKVRMVIDKVRADGLAQTVEAVRSKMSRSTPLGYCNVGRVSNLQSSRGGFGQGIRVASNGPHAELVRVPRNLTAPIPELVSDEAAAFTVPGAISLQGVRLLAPTLGERFAVIGQGLLGLLATQLLVANGCKVIAIDFDSEKLKLSRRWGADIVDLSKGQDAVLVAEQLTQGIGVDGVVIAASTASNEPIQSAARMCRKRGRIVLIGVVGLEMVRDDLYKKEISFQVSCSYGPGRYDPSYEEGGNDYPIGFVRWTAKRNFEAVLGLLEQKRLEVEPLISHRFPFEKAPSAYDLLLSGEPSLGILLEYSQSKNTSRRVENHTGVVSRNALPATGTPCVGFLGAGDYAIRTLMPAFQEAGVHLHTVVSSGGLTAAEAARKFGFKASSSDIEDVLSNPEIDTVVIATRHSTHARFVERAIRAGKTVFVEKPLAISREELTAIETALAECGSGAAVMIGFNRRFAPHVLKMRDLLAGRSGPKVVNITVNAGTLPSEHWTQDPNVGGGRIAGEGCHFIDLACCLVGQEVVSISAVPLDGAAGGSANSGVVNLVFKDGSVATITYLTNGHRSFPKERVLVSCEGSMLELENFRVLRGYGWPKFSKLSLWRQDKGNRETVRRFVESLRKGEPPPIPIHDILNVSRFTLDAVDALLNFNSSQVSTHGCADTGQATAVESA